ncbi:hypothetical protein NDU88_001793 [Pleurodeles waltl]|uniref:Uncharacterized protein n=1 Tax=Pleurodeles waltl TaxID=8319 RepID=A0AAV7KR68_PLEWA|nr:hypothetical protein NDU88_001793 [Pleurodeles waltl]
MCRLTEGVVKATVSTAGAVLWMRAVLELRRTRSAVACFPLRGRSSGSRSGGGRVSTSIVLALKQSAEEGAQADGAEEGNSTAEITEKSSGAVRGRGRRRQGKESLCCSRETAITGEANFRGKSGGCRGVPGDYLREVSSVSLQWKMILGAKLIKKGKVDPHESACTKITPSLRSYIKILPLVMADDPKRSMEVEGEDVVQSSVITAMEKAGVEKRVEETVIRNKGEKTKDQSSMLDAIAVLQEDQSGKTPPITMENNNRPVATIQLLRTEDGEEDASSSPIEEMITKLTEEIKKGFSVSEANQVSIRGACEMLEAKFDLLANRMQILGETMESLKEDVILIKQDLRQSRASEQDLQDKLERLENAARRNDLRILNVPKGVEGDDIKVFITHL